MYYHDCVLWNLLHPHSTECKIRIRISGKSPHGVGSHSIINSFHWQWKAKSERPLFLQLPLPATLVPQSDIGNDNALQDTQEQMGKVGCPKKTPGVGGTRGGGSRIGVRWRSESGHCRCKSSCRSRHDLCWFVHSSSANTTSKKSAVGVDELHGCRVGATGR